MQVLNDPLAQELMGSNIPARVAYTSVDGSPRAVPLGFHWNGEQGQKWGQCRERSPTRRSDSARSKVTTRRNSQAEIKPLRARVQHSFGHAAQEGKAASCRNAIHVQ